MGKKKRVAPTHPESEASKKRKVSTAATNNSWEWKPREKPLAES